LLNLKIQSYGSLLRIENSHFPLFFQSSPAVNNTSFRLLTIKII